MTVPRLKRLQTSKECYFHMEQILESDEHHKCIINILRKDGLCSMNDGA